MSHFAFLLSSIFTFILVSPVIAQSELEVDLELVLAVDVSRSMTPRELEIQRRGYADAIVTDGVISAIQGELIGQIALTYVEWAGEGRQRIVVDWTLIRGKADAAEFSKRLTAHINSNMRRTSISGGLDFAARHFDENMYTGLRRIIDVSGDGPNNEGFPVTVVRDGVVSQGIIINGQPLMTNEGLSNRWHLEDLDAYYQNCVIGGPGSFVLPVQDWIDFPRAVRRKLILEIADVRGLNFGPLNPILVASFSYDCLIGEKIRRRYFDDDYFP